MEQNIQPIKFLVWAILVKVDGTLKQICYRVEKDFITSPSILEEYLRINLPKNRWYRWEQDNPTFQYIIQDQTYYMDSYVFKSQQTEDPIYTPKNTLPFLTDRNSNL